MRPGNSARRLGGRVNNFQGTNRTGQKIGGSYDQAPRPWKVRTRRLDYRREIGLSAWNWR